jgi:exodeoxyribonuclease VII small subunit
VLSQSAVAEQMTQGSPSADASRYEEIVQRLAKVVERLEGGGLSLEESIAAFEEGIQLARAGAAKLEEAERKVELLLENDRVAPFGTDDGSRR